MARAYTEEHGAPVSLPDKDPTSFTGKTWAQPVKDLHDLMVKSAAALPGFMRQLRAWATDFSGGVVLTDLKPEDSIANKLARNGGRPPQALGDVLRGSILVQDVTTARDLAERLVTSGQAVAADDLFATPSDWGYNAFHLEVRTPEGLIAEVQIHTPETWDARMKLGGHDLYDKWEKNGKIRPEQEAAYRDDVEYARKIYADARVAAERGDYTPRAAELHLDFATGRWHVVDGATGAEIADVGQSVREARAVADAWEAEHGPTEVGPGHAEYPGFPDRTKPEVRTIMQAAAEQSVSRETVSPVEPVKMAPNPEGKLVPAETLTAQADAALAAAETDAKGLTAAAACAIGGAV